MDELIKIIEEAKLNFANLKEMLRTEQQKTKVITSIQMKLKNDIEIITMCSGNIDAYKEKTKNMYANTLAGVFI